MSAIEYEATGPVFQPGVPDSVLGSCLVESSDRVGELVVDTIREELATHVKHPTGFYEGHITTRRLGTGAKVTDSNVVYGPWLEGTAKRNETTRFKGYGSFRKTREQLDDSPKVVEVLDEVVRKYLGRLS